MSTGKWIFRAGWFLLLVTCHSSLLTATTGAITAVTVNTTGFDIYVTFSGFSPFGAFNTGLPGSSGGNNPNNALIVLTVTPPAYTPVSGMNNGARTVHGTWPIRYAYPNVWAASTSYALNNTISDGTHIQKVVTCAGTCTSASSHPTWNTSLGGTTVDNSGSNQITWQNMGGLPSDGAMNTCYDENTSVAGSLTVRIALDEEIYSDETAVVANIAAGLYTDNGSGGTGLSSLAASNLTVTDNSTLSYAKPIFRWTSVPYQRVTGPFVLEMTGGAHFAQNQGEVAAVTYTCTGGTSGHSNSVTVTQMTISTLFQDVNPVIVYAGTMPLAGFTQSETLTCNALVYPWYGDSNSVLNTAVGADGYAQPAETLGPQYEVNDPGNTYSPAFASVTTSGSNSTCTGLVFSTRAAAEASNGFATVGKAASCIEAYNAANNGHSDAGGGMIVLGSGTWTIGQGTSEFALGTMSTWLIVDKISTLAQSAVVIGTNSGYPIDSDKNTFLKFQNITFNSASQKLINGNSSGTDSFWLHNVSFTATGTGAIWQAPGAIWTTQSTFPSFTQGFERYSAEYRAPWALVRGANCASPEPSEIYTVVGNKNVVPINWIAAGDATLATNDGSVVAFNTDYNIGSTMPITPNGTTQAPTPHGNAWVQNLFENTYANGLFICGSSAPSVNCDNQVVHHMTLGCGGNPCAVANAGINSKFGYGYTAYSSPTGLTRYNWSMKWISNSYVNSKSDDYGTPNPANVGNWQLVYGTGFLGNLQGTEVNLSIEFFGLGFCGPCNPQYINDQTLGAGYGNYHILSTSQNINIAPWTTVASDCLPYDIEGHPRVGRVVAGVYTFGTARRGWR